MEEGKVPKKKVGIMRIKKAATTFILIAMLLGNLVLLSMQSQAPATEQLMEKNEVEGGGEGLKIYANFNLAQCFIASGTYELTRVSLYVMDQVPVDDPLAVQIYDNDDFGTPGFPNDDVPNVPIGPAEINNGPDNIFDWVDFTFSVPLAEGERYWIVASCVGMEGEGYRWKDSEGDAYPEGYIAYEGNPDWFIDNFNDLMFRVYGETENDVGVEEIKVPKHQEMYLETNITAMIKNYGSFDQGGFDVRCVIMDPFGGLVYDDMQYISFLGSGDVANLTWFFIPFIEGTYKITVTTYLPGDEYIPNDELSIEMKAHPMAVLKLHDEIDVDGIPNDWRGEGLSIEDTWHTSRREYIWSDAIGDDNGDGDYVYPLDFRFEPGCLDLWEFRVCVDSNSINFLLIFESIDDGSGDGTDGFLGFSEQIIEILIDVDRNGTGRDDTIRNARLKLDKEIGWEYALWTDGWDNGYVEDEFGYTYDIVNARGSPLSNAVEISIPVTSQVIPDFEMWRYVVLIGAQDNNSLPSSIGGSLSGFMKVDVIESSSGGGGGEDFNGADPNVYDMAFAFPQVPQLDNYGSVDFIIASFTNVTGGIGGGYIDNTEAWAQSFTAPFTCLLSAVDIYARDVGMNSMGMYIVIQANNDMGTADPTDDVPGSTMLSSIEIMDFALTYEWKNIIFSTPPLIREGETYWIVSASTEPNGQGYQWGKKDGNPWSSGTSAQYFASSWDPQPEDMLFSAWYRELTTVDAYQAIYFTPIMINEVCVNGSADYEWINIYYNGTNNAPDLNMSNWILTDQDDNYFQFENFLLSNKNSVTVHSGPGINSSIDLYWGRSIEVWHDFGDDVLLISNLMVPVDFMNYTDCFVFGDPPPYGLNWGPESKEEIPKNPTDLQILTLKIYGRENDFYSDWGIRAVGRIEYKSLYLHDDGTFDESDPNDFMNTTPPTGNAVPDFDNDGDPGLTLRNSGNPINPRTYQEFNLTPVLAKDFIIADDVLVEVWVDDPGGGSLETMIITLYDCNATTKIEIINNSEKFLTDDFSGWESISINIPDVDYVLQRGHHLVLHLMLDSSSEEDLWLAYNTTDQASCIRTIPTRTFINVDWGRTYDIGQVEKSDLNLGEEVIIKANVSDPFGSYDIVGANISVISPGEPVISFEGPMTLNTTDTNDPSVWKLFNFTFSDTNKAGIYTVNIKGIESNGVIHTITIYFNVLNNNAPNLTDYSLIPSTGYASWSFNYTINYTDIDNDPPEVMVVNITGLGIFDMIALDPGDLDYKDGKLYYINLTGFVNGTSYSYHFAANDSKGLWNETSEFSGPTISNTPPILSDTGLIPDIGNVSTPFNFTVNYTDIDNQPPDMITLNITGPSHAGSWAMVEVDPSDTDYTDGKIYYYNYTGFINGTYTHHFAANDSQGEWSETTELSEPLVLNTPPFLISAVVLPSIGYITTDFNYTVTYYDLDNQAPASNTVNITGTSHAGSWAMLEVDPSDTNYVDGKDYYYTYIGLTIGSYTFHCAANDTQDAWTETSEISGPNVLNTRPMLSNHNLDPTVGTAGSTLFNYTVTYTDLDDQAPGNITVNITGPFTGNFTMIELDPSDTDYSDGKEYYYSTTLPSDGNYAYRIDAYDTGGLWAIVLVDSGPNVGSAAPVLSQPKVDPTIGITTTWYNFTVNYTDLQNDSAGVITLNLSGPSGGIYTMLEAEPSDTNTTDGKFFYYNLTGLEKSIYWFYVQGNDSLGNYAESAIRVVPWVLNSLPQLSGSYINESNYGGSWFNFSLVYKDIDNDSPGNVNVNIFGWGNFTMMELDPADVDYTDGKEFYYNISIPKGLYIYRFEAIDSGFGARWNYTALDLIYLLNNIPIIEEQQVIPPTGFGGDYFNFTINISDYDNDTLAVYLYITGEPGSPFIMQELDILDTNTTDGKLFYYNLSLVKGTYNYNFSVYDGEESNQTIPLFLIVKNNPPVIITLDIVNTLEDSPYNVDYDHIDLDGDGVTWSLETNASWLNIDPNTGLLEGTTTNLEVGSYYVNVSVDDGDGGLDFHNFTLNVTNTLPLLTTTPDEFAKEDFLHLDDFNCIDDGQGNIVYSLLTNATWLDIDPISGLLSGTPDNLQVGWFWVNVTVDDGNGGMVSQNYTLTVNNTLPSITTMPIQVAVEDVLHLDDFNCDDDTQGNIVYSLNANATWLSLNPITGILSGTPDNTQVGWFWVNVTVNDGNGGFDSINYSLTVLNVPPTITTMPDDTAVEDSLHSDDFDCDDDNQGNITYSLYTNATWINIDPLSGVLSGTPNNTHVGSYWLNVTVNDGNGGADSRNYTLIVINTPPLITTIPDDTAIEDSLHYDDFDCDDDNQGNITYSLITNASWLSINSTSGELSGMPNNTHVGWYWVDVSVSDGNGGIDSRNYTLTVSDVNDPPMITTPNLEYVDEDMPYSVDYEFIDIDNDTATWGLETNASWLNIESDTGVLYGNPKNDDVGWFWVNITVDDGRGGLDYTNFTITVNNTPPTFTNTPVEFANEDEAHWDDFNCTDDSNGNIIYSLITNATWLNIDPFTGVLSGTTNNTHVGWYWVNVTVNDGNEGIDSINYTITVDNSIPFIVTTPDTDAYEDFTYTEDFDCIDDGQGVVTYHLQTNAIWLSINETTGMVTGMPLNDDVGTYWVTVTVDDGNSGTNSINYSLEVFNTNDPPIIITGYTEYIDEDSFYNLDFEFADVDDVSVVWSVNTNSTWLSINPNTGVLSGTPENEDVGWFYVNVTVDDGNGGFDHVNFTLIVNNTNDPPSVPQLLLPTDDSTVNTTFPTFTWSASVDPDRGDSVNNYTLQYSITSDFTDNLTTIIGIIDAFYTPTVPLDDYTLYYWRVEAFDSYGVGSGYQSIHFVFTIDTGYRPPLYIGGLKSAVVKLGYNWSIDLDYYYHFGSITDGLIFTCNYDEVNIDPDTHIATWTPKNMSSALPDVVFTLYDGKTNVSSFPIDLSVQQEIPPPSRPLSLWERIFWPWSLIPFIFLSILAGVMGYKKRKERPIVEEAFFISENGRLIAHATVSDDEDIDEDILGSMLTGVKDLISDAFIREEEGREEKGLHKLEFGEKNILLEKGNHFFIAVVFAGTENRALLSKISKIKDEIEEKYGDVLEDWDGEMTPFEEAEEIIQVLLSLEEFSKEKIEEAGETEKISEKLLNMDTEIEGGDITSPEVMDKE